MNENDKPATKDNGSSHEPLPMDFEAAIEAMKRCLPPPPYDTSLKVIEKRGRTEASDANPGLPELLGIFLACSEKPVVFGYKYRPDASDIVFLFFTSGRIRRLLVAARKLDIHRGIRKGLQEHLKKTASVSGPAWGMWGGYLGWFKLRALECFFDPRPSRLWYHESVSLERLLWRPLLDEEIAPTT